MLRFGREVGGFGRERIGVGGGVRCIGSEEGRRSRHAEAGADGSEKSRRVIIVILNSETEIRSNSTEPERTAARLLARPV